MARPRKRVRTELVPIAIQDQLSYFDTIRVQLFSRISLFLLKQLIKSTRPPIPDKKRRVIPKTKELPNGQVLHFLTIQQPSFRTLDILEAFRDGAMVASKHSGFEIVQVDVSLDLLVQSEADADRLGRYVIARLLKNGRPREPWRYESKKTQVKKKRIKAADGEQNDPRNEVETAYLSYGVRRGERVAVYADKHTKVASGGSCAHIEWRVCGAQSLRKKRLDDLDALRSFDHRQFWATHLRMLRAPSPDSLVAAAVSMRRSQKWFAKNASMSPTRKANMFVRAYMDKFGDVNSHDLLVTLRGLSRFFGTRPINLFLKMTNEWMLPSRENALWDDIWEAVVQKTTANANPEDSGTSRFKTLVVAAPRVKWMLPLFD